MLAIRAKREEQADSHGNLFLLRYEFLFFRCLRLTGERDAARDLLHDAYVQFVVNRPDLHSVNDLNAYLTRLVQNVYASQMRMARSQKKNHIPIEDFDSAAMALRNNRDFSAQLHAQQELIWISRYVFLRRENSRDASTLILRYFHGYYAWEIASILNTTEIVVHSLLKRARRDVRESLRTRDGNRWLFAGLPEYMMDLRAGVPTTEFIKALRKALLRPANGHCIPWNELDSLSCLSRAMNCAHLAHVVHCAHCLDRVNRLKGLDPLSERHGVDAADGEKRGRKSGGSGEPPEPPLPTGISRELANQVEDTIQHRPETLQVRVNGFLIASQKICSAVSELDLTVAIDETVDFVEVLSEQGVRLLFMNVDLPSRRSMVQVQQVCLSDGRTLGTVLSFDDERPTLRIRYEDPTFEALMSSAGRLDVVVRPVLLPHFGPHDEPKDTTTGALKDALRWLSEGFQHIGQWAKFVHLDGAGLATASVALILVLALVIYQMRPEIVSASELLDRSSRSDQADNQDPTIVQHRSLILDEFDYPRTHRISRHRIEIWHSAQKQVWLRRLFDQKNRILAEERIEGNETPKIFWPAAGKPTSVQNPLQGDNGWLLDLSASSFSSIIPRPDKARVDKGQKTYVINYEGTVAPTHMTEPVLLRGSLTLDKSTLHATQEELVVRDADRTRELQITEAAVERLPSDTVDPKVLEPILAEGDTKIIASKVLIIKNLGGPKPAAEALLELQVDAFYRLNQIGPELVNQIRVSRTADGHLEVQGTVDSEERKADVLSALSPISSNALLETNIRSLSEALVLQSKECPEPFLAKEVETTKTDIPVARELSQYFEDQWDKQSRGTAARMPTDWVRNRIREYSGAVLGQSYRAYLHALALRNLMTELASSEIGSLDKAHRSKLDALVRSHAEAICLETRAIRQELQPIFFGGETPQGGGTPTGDLGEAQDTDKRKMSEIVFAKTSANDATIVSTFTASHDSLTNAVSNLRLLEQSLEKLEDLTNKLATSRE